MAKIRVATFNVENLLQRFNFRVFGKLKKERALEILGVENEQEKMLLRKAASVSLEDDSRQMTAQAIRDTQADIICLQEVDNQEILDDFHEYYLERSVGIHYGWKRLIDGNDPRGIDVAVMSKSRITVYSHAQHTFDEFNLFTSELDDYGLNPGDRIFRRDCLEVELKVEGEPLSLFICHLKSLIGGRDATRSVREAETKAIRKIIENKFKDQITHSNWLIPGDFNDYTHDMDGNPVSSSLEPLLNDGFAKDLLQNLDFPDRWTHYYPKDKPFHQIDFIMASPAIYQKNSDVKPNIIRGGQPYCVPGLQSVERYPRVGYDRPKASDHCPVAVTLNL